jgi:TetR/AcrR family transcriptional regulator, regulator of autoinduction and epiphytic fitness
VREPVKGKTDAGRQREERARHKRQRVVDAASRLFLERGYVATTMEAIAAEAAVAPATVYQAFGTKQAVLSRILDQTVAGDAGPAALLDRDWVKQASQHPGPRQRLAMVIQHTSQVAARTAPIKEVMRDAAAGDPAVRQLLREDDQRRYITQQALVDLAIGEDQLRDGCDRDHAAATFFALVNSNCYQLLATHLGWNPADWQQWLTTILERDLFGVSEPGSTHAWPQRQG